ncbi:MAG: hypothetical protein E6767_17865 [Dysgonomonas sp.]|nr:hypothetical protein [Dysgonomonas sp.]
MNLPELLTLQTAASYLHIRPISKLKQMALNNEIVFIGIGKNILFTPQHLLDFINSKDTSKLGRSRK